MPNCVKSIPIATQTTGVNVDWKATESDPRAYAKVTKKSCPVMDDLGAQAFAIDNLIAIHPAPAALVDRNFTIINANSLFGALLGLTPGTATGRQLTDFLMKESDRIRVRHAAAAASQQAPDIHHHVSFRDTHGHAIESPLTQRVIFDDAGAITGYVFVANTSAETSDETRDLSKLLGGLAHDFNNVLTVISGNLYAALDYREPSMIRSRVERAVQATQYAADLTAAVRTLTTGAKLHMAAIDLNEVISDVPGTYSDDNRTHFEIDEKITASPAMVRGDTLAIQRVLHNLIQNARDAGATTIRLTRSDITQQGGMDQIAITMSDNGGGIPHAIRSRIFMPYVSQKGGSHTDARNDIANQPPGYSNATHMGLGLAIAKRLMQQMGGDITLTDAPKGFDTCFLLHWPALKTATKSTDV